MGASEGLQGEGAGSAEAAKVGSSERMWAPLRGCGRVGSPERMWAPLRGCGLL